jgi:hypothetical protein
MGRHYVSYEAACPFYKGEDKNAIYCEGIVEESTVKNAFGSVAAAEACKRRLCCGKWETCPLAKALSAKYE